MPLKREKSTESDEECRSKFSPKKTRTFQGKKSFTPEEESAFLEIIDEVVKAGLWNAAKNHPELNGRKQNSVLGHWDAMYRKLRKS
ncbi:uncharacterized protein I303_104607 [Kwoniella dejecticola CBS 10117]|uniref:Myb-like domain-containing protein n=1 Tax=Kwoniella dejecticola CBS 10117 TaxID=1296121 RepID=A0A1A6A4U2_9TREE|nr:uncharacterized protein I303_04415 [Kwoniella dejecticola CBS 10117]OBR85084.1 hypothetical protein I303_04415 [Kwoniella dejecticola CBS 10117]